MKFAGRSANGYKAFLFIMEGWIKLHRKFVSWEWFTDFKTSHLFLYLLLSANHEDKNWRGQKVKRGQLITGRKSLSEKTGLSEQTIRTSIDRLKSTNEITIKTTNKNSLITVLNYDFYQNKETANQQTNQQLTNKQPTTNQQLTTNKNVNNIKNDNNDKKVYSNDVNFLYSLYPTKCPIKNNSTGKGDRNKKQIEKLLKSKTKEELKNTIEFYIDDCKRSNTWIKNFSTFLNNLPEVNQMVYFKTDFDADSVYRELTKKDFDNSQFASHLDRLIIFDNKPEYKNLIK